MNSTVIYGKSKCGKCGKENTLDKMIWSDTNEAHVCLGCANIAECEVSEHCKGLTK